MLFKEHKKQSLFLKFEEIKIGSKWAFNDGAKAYVTVIETKNNWIYYRCTLANGKIDPHIFDKDTFSFQVRYRPMIEEK